MGFTPVYPPAFSSSYFTASGAASTGKPWYSANPASSLTGGAGGTSWFMSFSVSYMVKFIVDLNVNAAAISRVILDNYHSAGGSTGNGVKDIKLFGSNDYNCKYATYDDETNLTLLTTFTLAQHVAADVADPQTFDFVNTTTFQYYVFKIISCQSPLPLQYGWRHVVLLKDDTPPPVTGNITGTFPAPTGSITGTVPDSTIYGNITGTLPAIAGAITGTVPVVGNLAGTFPGLSGSMSGAQEYVPVDMGWHAIFPDVSGSNGPLNVRASQEWETTKAWFSCDQARSIVNEPDMNTWGAAWASKFSINYGTPKVFTRVHIENYHNFGTDTSFGVRDIKLFGTNSQAAGENVGNYADETDLTLLATFTMPAHVASNVPDPQCFDFPNQTAFQYYVFKCASNPHGNPIGWRRVELQEPMAYMTGGIVAGTFPSWNDTTTAKVTGILPALTGQIYAGGTVRATFPSFSGEIRGVAPSVGKVAGELPALTGHCFGGGYLQGAWPAMTGTIKGTVLVKGTLIDTWPAMTGTVKGSVAIHGRIEASFPAMQGAITGQVSASGSITGFMPALCGSIAGHVDVGGSVFCTLPTFTGSITGGPSRPSEISGFFPALCGSIRGTVPRRDSTLRHIRNQVN